MEEGIEHRIEQSQFSQGVKPRQNVVPVHRPNPRKEGNLYTAGHQYGINSERKEEIFHELLQFVISYVFEGDIGEFSSQSSDINSLDDITEKALNRWNILNLGDFANIGEQVRVTERYGGARKLEFGPSEWGRKVTAIYSPGRPDTDEDYRNIDASLTIVSEGKDLAKHLAMLEDALKNANEKTRTPIHELLSGRPSIDYRKTVWDFTRSRYIRGHKDDIRGIKLKFEMGDAPHWIFHTVNNQMKSLQGTISGCGEHFEKVIARGREEADRKHYGSVSAGRFSYKLPEGRRGIAISTAPFSEMNGERKTEVDNPEHGVTSSLSSDKSANSYFNISFEGGRMSYRNALLWCGMALAKLDGLSEKMAEDQGIKFEKPQTGKGYHI